ncbi:MAG: hypothetical protein HPAVJP_2410 [Candidatus Hepatoplasma vulgare]|nr:MAG: hypothetical protein HPAVJP_2410 [Candidatus Hepatoplasma sp.]
MASDVIDTANALLIKKANNDEDLKIFNATVYSYTEDVKLMEKMGLKYFNFHPVSFRKREEGIKRCAFGTNEIIEKTKNSNVILCIETMMKKENYIGKNFNEIREIIDLAENKKRIGVVMDTCHIWDGGYDIRNIDEVLNEFDKIIGLHYLKGMHINDSKNELGSNKDRHANIGKGEIGLEALKKIVFHPKLINLPKALETPYGKDDFKRWKEEISLLID